MEQYDISELSRYEEKAWQSVQKWREQQSKTSTRLPASVTDGAKQALDVASTAWKATPGTAQIEEIAAQVLEGGYEALTDAVAASLQRDRILQAARDNGATASELSDLHKLDLREIDEILPRLNLRYATASAATGATSGLVAGGGTAAVLGTGGVAAAPGGLAVFSALGGDVVATIGLAARVVSHYAGYHGYDTREEEEKAVLLAVIGVGVAGRGAAKQAALLHVRQVAMMLARRATWKELGEEAVVKLVQSIFAKLSVRLTQRKLAQALPAIGVAAGAGLNYSLMRRVGTAASYMYKERFLIEKYGLDEDEPTPTYEDIIDVEVIRETAELESSDESTEDET